MIPRYFRQQKGAAAAEMALVLPLLLVLVFGLYEFGRAIAANNVITNISREGANLASRTEGASQEIMSALAKTADQVNFGDFGTIYVTRILETTIGGSGRGPQVLEQSRWIGSGLTTHPDSRVWSCEANGSSNWVDDECAINPDIHSINRTATLPMSLNNSEEIVAVEVYFTYRPALQFFIKKDLPLYSLTLL